MLVTSIINNFVEFVYFVKILGVQVFTMPMILFFVIWLLTGPDVTGGSVFALSKGNCARCKLCSYRRHLALVADTVLREIVKYI